MSVPLRSPLPSLAIILLTALLLSPAHAAETPNGVTIALQPSDAHGRALPGPGYFVLRISAGKTRRLHVIVTNRGTHTSWVTVTPVDARRDQRGNISYNLPNAPRTHVGSWAYLPRSTFKLRAGARIIVPFALRIPARLRPGTYVGALTAYVRLPKAPPSARDMLRVQFRLADAIVVTVRAARSPHTFTGSQHDG